MSHTHPPRLARRIVRRLVRLGAFLLIALAGVAATLRLLLPWLVGDPQRVAAFLSDKLHTPVSLVSSEARVLGTGPLVHLRGLRLGAEPALVLQEVDLELDFAAFVLPWRRVIRDVRVNGLDILVERSAEGFKVHGVPAPPPGAPPLSVWLSRIGQLSIHGSKLRFVDSVLDSSFTVEPFQARLQRNGDLLQFGARLGADLRLAGSYQPGSARPFTAWLGGTANLSDTGGLRLAGIGPVAGDVDLQLRVELDELWKAQFRLAFETRELVYQARALPLPDDLGLVEARHALPHLMLRAAGEFSREHGLQVPAFEWGTEPEALAVGRLEWPRGGEARLALEQLEVGPLSDLLAASTLLPDTLATRLYLSAPQARLERLEAVWGRPGDWHLTGQLSRLAFNGWDVVVPGVRQMALNFSADRRGAQFQISSPAAQIQSALALRAPVDFSLTAHGSAWPELDRMRIELDQFEVKTGAAHAVGNLQLEVGAGRPAFMDLQGTVLAGDVHTAKTLVIINKMPPRAIDWMDRALVEGKVVAGAAVYRGELGKPAWPFAEQQGRFDAVTTLVDGILDYHPDWPRAEKFATEVRFVNDSMQMLSASGVVSGAAITATAEVKVFKEPILEAQFKGAGDARDWLLFLRGSPLGVLHGSQLLGMEASGPVDAEARLVLPLKRSLGEPSLDGHAQVHGMDFVDRKWLLDFRQVKGKAHFTREGFAADGLQLSTASGSKGQLGIAVGLTADPKQVVEASLQGQFSTQDLFGQHEALSPILARISGRSDWQVELGVPRGKDGGPSVLTMFSPLRGTTIDMPAPLGKVATVQRTLALSMELPVDVGRPLRLSLGDNARFEARLGSPDQDFAGVLRLGPGAISGKQPKRGLWLEGEVPENDPMSWMGLIGGLVAGGESEEGSFAGADLRLTVPDQARAGTLKITPDPTGWRVSIDAQLAKGRLVWQLKHGQESLSGDFETLHLPTSEHSTGDLPSINPGSIPALHLRVADFRSGPAKLGSLRLETFPVADGLQVELVESTSSELQMRGKGLWQGVGAAQRSSVDMQFSANDLGKMLTSLGFAGQVAGGQTLTTLTASWPGSPSAFGLERIDGSLDIWIGAGRFLEVEPGAGRLFGLLSLSELPRRLALDFRDFFQSGMAFDEIKGRFVLDEGNAWTENLAIKAPAADVLIIGRTGIAARDYDQQMVVSPKVGNVLPLVGALAGGPGGAAAGLLAQGVLRGGKDAFLREYRISGTWEKPQILREEIRRSARGEEIPPPG